MGHGASGLTSISWTRERAVWKAWSTGASRSLSLDRSSFSVGSFARSKSWYYIPPRWMSFMPGEVPVTSARRVMLNGPAGMSM